MSRFKLNRKDFDELEEFARNLKAENAKLREAAQAVVDDATEPDSDGDYMVNEFHLNNLAAALGGKT
jgi:hypothetical protein